MPQGNPSAPTTLTMTSSAVKLLSVNSTRKQAVVFNVGPSTVYVGNFSTVTTATGIPIPPNTGFQDDLTSAEWYGIVATTSTSDMRVTEVS
jgi:hypothetical protein